MATPWTATWGPGSRDPAKNLHIYPDSSSQDRHRHVPECHSPCPGNDILPSCLFLTCSSYFSTAVGRNNDSSGEESLLLSDSDTIESIPGFHKTRLPVGTYQSQLEDSPCSNPVHIIALDSRGRESNAPHFRRPAEMQSGLSGGPPVPAWWPGPHLSGEGIGPTRWSILP